MFRDYKQLFKFLNRYIYSRDVSIPEQLSSYFNEYDIEHHRSLVNTIKAFLDEDFTLSEKETLIQSHIYIEFDTKRHTPMLFLTSILATIETRIVRIEQREKEMAELIHKYGKLTSFLTQFKCNRKVTPEDILNRYFNRTQPEEWRVIEGLIRDFLAEELSKKKQNTLINQHVEIDFHYRNTTPTLWLKGVANSIVYRLNWCNISEE